MTVQELRDKAAELRQTAESHYRWANCGCLSIEYAGWVAAGDAAYAKAAELDRQANELAKG
jgi:hypothetical protein